VAIATMCTASSSGSLRRTLAQFARLPLARIEIQTPGTLLVDLSGIGKFCCPVQPVIYILLLYKHNPFVASCRKEMACFGHVPSNYGS